MVMAMVMDTGILIMDLDIPITVMVMVLITMLSVIGSSRPVEVREEHLSHGRRHAVFLILVSEALKNYDTSGDFETFTCVSHRGPE